MDRNDLLKHIAETGYNVGFGAKKHFATFDIVNKAPGVISFLSMAVGILALVCKNFSTNWVSAALIILGIIGLYISMRSRDNNKYEATGNKLIKMFNELKTLYFKVKEASPESLENHNVTLNSIEAKYCDSCISDQVLFSGWWAHYKFFWEHQIGWIEEQKKFKFFRDKVPLTLTVTMILVVLFMLVIPVCVTGWSLIKGWLS